MINGVSLGTLYVTCVSSATEVLVFVHHSNHVSAYRMLSALDNMHRVTSVSRSVSFIKYIEKCKFTEKEFQFFFYSFCWKHLLALQIIIDLHLRCIQKRKYSVM
jgi:hypothetical protein